MSIMIPAWVDGTLVPVEKLEAHKKGLRHKAVSVFVLRGSEMLLQRRALGKYHTPGLWANTCCTHPDWDEAPEVCALRRLDEELGITCVTPEFRQNLEYRADVGGDLIEHEVVDVFVAHAGDDFTMALNPEEVMEAEWVDHHEVRRRIDANPDSFTPWMRIYMDQHADAIFGNELA
ncbi:Isopentenyl-diphosphate Delta-isomerase [Ascidiaceihabitans donghaensis]|uniref:Isopentenyl-diphosphate Delta-isomerase n=1 Tax=Ascidiaceihabitans donghaensis TaxID=1510460 RepID=A0A2R8BP83_9RHOB|nr:isopentenyl-diphosphate Delta-isomerase [Ascidiaceihabitans donghaensis]SPH27392.1 Isopentenyl-diphosphate Delta-isomerase [Ascidiaceihabitans donghaensis]